MTNYKIISIVIISIMGGLFFPENIGKELGYKVGYYIRTGTWVDVKYEKIDFYLINKEND